MPDVDTWERFFDPPRVLARLGLDGAVTDAVEFGSGYATFTLPAARIVRGRITAIDIDPAMIAFGSVRAADAGVRNIDFVERDFMRDGTGLADGAVDYAMLFNILHAENPVALLREARRSVGTAGRVGVMHWDFDPRTPRGPPLAIRPLPEHVEQWAADAAFACSDRIELPPFHYGYILHA